MNETAKERRERAELQFAGDTDTFLRSCDIRVHIEHDITTYLDQALELIRCTGKLNLTKKQLPEAPHEARSVFLGEASHFYSLTGLVRVTDRFGDYGFVGLFLKIQGDALSPGWLSHFCFADEILGTRTETWLYRHLGSPGIALPGEVAVDLWDGKKIDWISLASVDGERPNDLSAKVPEIRIVGGCEGNIFSHYLAYNAQRLRTEASLSTKGLFVRVNSASNLLSASSRAGQKFKDETATLGLPYEQLVSRFFDEAQQGSFLIYSGHMDFGYVGYEHKEEGWHIKVEPSEYFADITLMSDDAIQQYLATKSFDIETKSHISHVISHIRSNYVSVFGPRKDKFREQMRTIVSSVPDGARLIILVPDNRVRVNGLLETLTAVDLYIDRLRACLADSPEVSLIYYRDCISSEDEIGDGWFHYDRIVYLRVARAIRDLIGSRAQAARVEAVSGGA